MSHSTQYNFADLVDIKLLQGLSEELLNASGIPSAIISREGEILCGAGFQDICMKFHRKHPDCEKDCIKSDKRINREIESGKDFILYKCPRGLVDAATPIIIDGVHYGSAFTGQLLTEPLNDETIEHFRKQAEEFGFDTGEYMNALHNVPVITEKKVESYLRFLVKLTKMITESALKTKKSLENNIQLEKTTKKLKLLKKNTPFAMIDWDPEFNVLEWNPAAEQIFGYSESEAVGRNAADLILDNVLQEQLKVVMEDIVNLRGGLRNINKNITKDRSEITCEWFNTPLVDNEGSIEGVTSFAIDITEQELARQLLERNEFNMRQAGRIGEIGFWEFDVQRNLFTKWTDEIFMIYEIEKTAEIELETALQYVHKEDRHLLQEVIYRANKFGEEFDHDLRFDSANHNHKWIRIIGKPVNFDGKAVMLFGTIQNITNRKEIEIILEKLNAELNEKNKELEQIVYVASHDLRSPLVNIQGFSEELKLTLNNFFEFVNSYSDSGKTKHLNEFNAELRDSLGFILSSVRKMDSLLKGLLKLSRLGRKNLEMKKIDMNRLLEESLESFEYMVQNKEIEITVERLPDCVGDEMQISQVFANLIDNAIKYRSEKRKALITIKGFNADNNTVYVVEDNGIGIPDEHQKNVFEIFNRLHSDDYSGEGLGLTIVRKIISMHGGSIMLKSDIDTGSKFYVSIPNPQ